MYVYIEMYTNKYTNIPVCNVNVQNFIICLEEALHLMLKGKLTHQNVIIITMIKSKLLL